MKFLKKFNTETEYNTFKSSSDYITPNVSLIGLDGVMYNPIIPPPLYVEALYDLTVQFSTNAIQYSLDNSTWVDLPAATATPTINSGSKVYFRASGLTPSSSAGIGTFSMTGSCNVGGNIMSMVYGEEYVGKTTLSGEYQFYKLFYGANRIKEASQLILPATTLARSCYEHMFTNCNSLTIAPKLPATTLVSSCYSNMFYGCKSLTTAPELPATTLVSSCYSQMFYNCKKVSYIKAMFTTTPSQTYTMSWVDGVASTGTFVKNAAATWDVTGYHGIPSGWTVETATA